MLFGFFRKMRSARLNAVEKAEIKNRLILEMSGQYDLVGDGRKNIFSNIFLKINFTRMIASILLALLLVTGGGTAYAAENALPGDTLYPVKISVNEQVREMLTFGDENKAEVALQMAERRLGEVVELFEKGQLTEQTIEKVAVNFEKHLERAKEKATKFGEEGKLNAAEKVNERARAMLQVHEEFFKEAKEVNAAKLENTVKTQLEKMKEKKEAVMAKVESATDVEKENAANGAKGAAENKLAEVNKFIENRADKVSAEAVKKAQDIVVEANTLKSQADEKLTAKEFVGAFKLYHEAMMKAQSAKAVLKINETKEKIAAVKLKLEEKVKIQEQKKLEKKNKEAELPEISGVQIETFSGAAVVVTEDDDDNGETGENGKGKMQGFANGKEQ